MTRSFRHLFSLTVATLCLMGWSCTNDEVERQDLREGTGGTQSAKTEVTAGNAMPGTTSVFATGTGTGSGTDGNDDADDDDADDDDDVDADDDDTDDETNDDDEETGDDGVTPDDGDDGGELPTPPPTTAERVAADKLSLTGLYSDVATLQVRGDVRTYVPGYVLWSDGAEKDRYVFFPAGTSIDTSNMDQWKYPVGTVLWKDFKVNGMRV